MFFTSKNRSYLKGLTLLALLLSLVLGYEAVAAEKEEWVKVETQNAGTLMLPSSWNVAEKDGPVQTQQAAEGSVNLQMALVAQPLLPPEKDSIASLSLITVWGLSPKGEFIPLPMGEDEIQGLIQAMSQGVEQQLQSKFNLAVEVKPVSTEELTFGKKSFTLATNEIAHEDKVLRYKVALGKEEVRLSLIMVIYEAKNEDYIASNLKTVLEKWVY